MKFLKLYSDPHNLVLVINTSSSQEVSKNTNHNSVLVKIVD